VFIFCVSTVSAQSLSADNDAKIIRSFPNPATTFINFDFIKNYDKGYNLQIYNFMGKRVYDVNNISSQSRVSLQDFYRGMYIYQLRNKNGQIVDSGKFQVVK